MAKKSAKLSARLEDSRNAPLTRLLLGARRSLFALTACLDRVLTIVTRCVCRAGSKMTEITLAEGTGNRWGLEQNYTRSRKAYYRPQTATEAAEAWADGQARHSARQPGMCLGLASTHSDRRGACHSLAVWSAEAGALPGCRRGSAPLMSPKTCCFARGTAVDPLHAARPGEACNSGRTMWTAAM